VTRFPTDEAELMRVARTVDIETSAGPGKPVHRAVVWIVVDEDGRAFVRSWLGRRGRWYRELEANPRGAVHVGDRRIAVTATHADAHGIGICSRLLRAKHRSSRASLLSMLRVEILETTLELRPA
jgi:hypothetical protein